MKTRLGKRQGSMTYPNKAKIGFGLKGWFLIQWKLLWKNTSYRSHKCLDSICLRGSNVRLLCSTVWLEKPIATLKPHQPWMATKPSSILLRTGRHSCINSHIQHTYIYIHIQTYCFPKRSLAYLLPCLLTFSVLACPILALICIFSLNLWLKPMDFFNTCMNFEIWNDLLSTFSFDRRWLQRMKLQLKTQSQVNLGCIDRCISSLNVWFWMDHIWSSSLRYVWIPISLTCLPVFFETCLIPRMWAKAGRNMFSIGFPVPVLSTLANHLYVL